MANELLTAQMITREALDILHSKLTFIGTINRQYDSSFGKEGAKIGSQLKIRLPNEYTVRTGRVASPQATVEKSETLVVATQKGVDSEFYSDELALSLDDFSERILAPQMARLASELEKDALTMAKDVPDLANASGTALTSLSPFLNARARLMRNLAPSEGLNVQITPDGMATMVNGVAAYYHEARAIAHQYREGFLLRNSSFDYYEQTMLPRLLHGTATTATTLVNGANQGGDGSLIVDGCGVATGTLKAGQVFTIASVYAVHPETKEALSYLKQFVVTADVTFAAGAGTISFEPKIVTSGAYQNVDAGPADDAQVTFDGTVSTTYDMNLAYHRDAFAFVTADLPVPKGMDMAYIARKDGLSLRFVRGFDIISDQFISRFDVLYGYKTIRRQLACRVAG